MTRMVKIHFLLVLIPYFLLQGSFSFAENPDSAYLKAKPCKSSADNALITAIKRDELQDLQLALQKRANVNCNLLRDDSPWSITPLHVALLTGASNRIALELLNRGADFDHFAYKRLTPEDLAFSDTSDSDRGPVLQRIRELRIRRGTNPK